MARRSANCEMMVRAAIKAARGLVRDFGEVEQLQVSLKGPADFVSNADRRAERILKEELKRARPELDLQQRQGRALLWDKTVNRELQDEFRAGRVAQQAYVYYAYSDSK